jgi:GntR family transcriptional regulator
VSQGTVRKAIESLAADNLVVRRQGKGTFVATHTEDSRRRSASLRIRRSDGNDEYPTSRLLDVRRAKASAETARLLELRGPATR